MDEISLDGVDRGIDASDVHEALNRSLLVSVRIEVSGSRYASRITPNHAPLPYHEKAFRNETGCTLAASSLALTSALMRAASSSSGR